MRRRVEPDYAADLSVPMLDSGRNAKTKEDRLLNHVQFLIGYSFRDYYFNFKYKVINKTFKKQELDKLFIMILINFKSIFVCFEQTNIFSMPYCHCMKIILNIVRLYEWNHRTF